MSDTVRVQRWAIVCWSVAIVVIFARVLVRGDRANRLYSVFAQAGEHWLQGAGLYVDTGFRYPPITAAALVPFHLAGDLAGSLLWRALNIAVYLGALLVVLRRGQVPAAVASRRGAFFLLLLVPSLTALGNGQPNGILIGAVVLSASAFARGRHAAAAAWATLPVCLKVFPLAFGLLLAVLEPRRFLPWFAALVALAALLPFALQDPAYVADEYASLVRVLAAEDRTGDPLDAYRELRQLLASLGLPISDRLYLVLQALTGAALAALCWLGRRRGWSAEAVAGTAVGGAAVWMTVMGPSTEKATYIVVAPLLAFLVVAHAGRRGSWFWWCVVAYAVMLGTHVVTRAPHEVQASWTILRSLPTIATLLAAVALLRMAGGGPDPTES